MMRPLRVLLAGWLIVLTANAVVAQDRPRVIAVNYALQYFAERLLGDAADVVFPVPDDVDPSFWRPTVADISMIQASDLILLNGAGFATWVDRVSLPRAKLVNTSAAIEDRFVVTESITHSHGDGGEHSHEGLAAYTWLDPSLAMAQADAIAAAITARGLAAEGEVAARLEGLRSDLAALDQNAATAFGQLADIGIITTHPRYQYLASRYNLSIASLEWEAGAMPTEEQVADLRTLADETAGQILIWEAKPPAAAFAMANDLGLRNVVFAPLAHQFEDDSFLVAFADAIAALSKAGG